MTGGVRHTVGLQPGNRWNAISATMDQDEQRGIDSGQIW